MRWGLHLVLCLLPCAAMADEAADKSFLTTWLEQNLSGAGRVVSIDGFQGALSTQASLTSMTIADDQGVWLTLKGVTLDWSRSALLSGKIEISDLSATEIDLQRIPQRQTDGLPPAEAMSLKLPELPVSIAIDKIAAKHIKLGPSVLGQPVEASLTADLSLAGGEGTAHLDLQRMGDGPDGHVTLSAGYSNATTVLDLTLDATEGPGGIAASLLHIPGAPSASLTVQGKGPLSDFAATVDLSTDGQTRLAGAVTMRDDSGGNRSFTADLSGDPTPVFLPQYAAFFGPDVALKIKGNRSSDGTVRVDDLSVSAQAIHLSGNMALTAAGQPQSLNLTGTVGLPNGPVTLPVATDSPITLRSAAVSLQFDASRSEVWTFASTVNGFDGSSIAAGLLRLTAEGRLRAGLFDGTARFTALSLAPHDPALAEALGPTVTGSAGFSWNRDTSALQIGNLVLAAPGYSVTTSGDIGPLVTLNGTVSGHYDDLTRLSKLAGRPLSGAARFALTGEANPISGAFDLSGTVLGKALAIGLPEVDRLLDGASRVELSAKRDETGSTLRNLTVVAKSLDADLSGTITSSGSRISGALNFADLSVLGPNYHGALSAEGAFAGTMAAGRLSAKATGQDLRIGQPQADGLLAGGSALEIAATLKDGVATVEKAGISSAQGKVEITGTASTGGSDLKACLSLPNLAALGAGFRGAVEGGATFVGTAQAGKVTVALTGRDLAVGKVQADAILRGASAVAGEASLTPDGLRIDRAEITTEQLKASVTGAVQGAARNLAISARLANLGLLYPDFPGPLTISGTARQDGQGTALDLTAKGPGEIDAAVKGSVTANFTRANLTLRGTATAALANALIAPRSISGALRFDLNLNGPFALSSLSGPITLTGGRLADPAQTFGLQDIAATARLDRSRAQIAATAGVTSGGRVGVNGSVGLSPSHQADLAITLTDVGLRNPDLYSTTLSGSVTMKGAALGGAMIAGTVTLGRTELRIPSTGFGADGDLPGLRHVNEPADVRATRGRAGVGATNTPRDPGPGYGLNLRILAPNQVFVRGRGLDAELGGSLTLRGTTRDIVPSGALNLLRGRLDILGRRLVLSEAQLQMQGALVPFVHIVASIESGGITSSVVIDGEATDPTVTFTSTPDLPQEEVVAQLLFNRGLENISPFQAAQLASAIATLAGKGGEGVMGAVRSKSGLDNLDVQADGTGNTSVTAGKYFSDKIYSEVTVDQQGKSSISLNYDVSSGVTMKLHVESEGTAGAGVFLQRDY